MAKTDWTLEDKVQPSDMNTIGQEINQLREDVDNMDFPLSDEPNGTRSDVAASEKAVGLVMQEAQAAKTAGDERKQQAVDALIAWGVSASKADSWDTLFNKMASVIKATGNATLEDVLAGKTFSNATGNNLVGNMPDQGAQVIIPGLADIPIPKGYHNGDGLVKAGYPVGGYVHRSKLSYVPTYNPFTETGRSMTWEGTQKYNSDALKHEELVNNKDFGYFQIDTSTTPNKFDAYFYRSSNLGFKKQFLGLTAPTASTYYGISVYPMIDYNGNMYFEIYDNPAALYRWICITSTGTLVSISFANSRKALFSKSFTWLFHGGTTVFKMTAPFASMEQKAVTYVGNPCLVQDDSGIFYTIDSSFVLHKYNYSTGTEVANVDLKAVAGFTLDSYLNAGIWLAKDGSLYIAAKYYSGGQKPILIKLNGDLSKAWTKVFLDACSGTVSVMFDQFDNLFFVYNNRAEQGRQFIYHLRRNDGGTLLGVNYDAYLADSYPISFNPTGDPSLVYFNDSKYVGIWGVYQFRFYAKITN